MDILLMYIKYCNIAFKNCYLPVDKLVAPLLYDIIQKLIFFLETRHINRAADQLHGY